VIWLALDDLNKLKKLPTTWTAINRLIRDEGFPSGRERALALLLAKERYYILLRANDTEAEAVQWHIEQGLLDPEKQEPTFIMSQIPGKSRRCKANATDELPKMARKDEIEPSPHVSSFELAEPPKPKPVKRTPIYYPAQTY
jgi:hypothetical protein